MSHWLQITLLLGIYLHFFKPSQIIGFTTRRTHCFMCEGKKEFFHHVKFLSTCWKMFYYVCHTSFFFPIVMKTFSIYRAELISTSFICLRQNTLRLGAGIHGEVNRAEALQSEGGFAMAQFCLISHRLKKIPFYLESGKLYWDPSW